MTNEQQAFLKALQEDLAKPSVFERVGFDANETPSDDEIEKLTQETVSAVRAILPAGDQREELLLQIERARAMAVLEVGKQRPTVAQSVPAQAYPPSRPAPVESNWTPKSLQAPISRNQTLFIVGLLLVGICGAVIATKQSHDSRSDELENTKTVAPPVKESEKITPPGNSAGENIPATDPVPKTPADDTSQHVLAVDDIPEFIEQTVQEIETVGSAGEQDELLGSLAIVAWRAKEEKTAFKLLGKIADNSTRHFYGYHVADNQAFANDFDGAKSTIAKYTSLKSPSSPVYVIALSRQGQEAEAKLVAANMPKAGIYSAYGHVLKAESAEAKRILIDQEHFSEAEAEANIALMETSSTALSTEERRAKVDQAFKWVSEQSSLNIGDMIFPVCFLKAQMGDADEAIKYTQDLVKRADAVEHGPKMAENLDTILEMLRQDGALAKARSGNFEEATSLVNQLKRRINQANALLKIACIYYDADNKEMAEKTLSQAIKLINRLSRADKVADIPSIGPSPRFVVYATLVYAQVHTGHIEEAKRTLQKYDSDEDEIKEWARDYIRNDVGKAEIKSARAAFHLAIINALAMPKEEMQGISDVYFDYLTEFSLQARRR